MLLVRIYVAIVCLVPLGLFAQPISGPFPYLEGTKYGFGTLQGKKLTEAIYDTHSFFHFGYCAVRQGCCYGVLDTTFAWVLPPQFDYCEVADTGLFLCRSGERKWVYKGNKQLFYTEKGLFEVNRKWQLISMKLDSTWAYYNYTGQKVQESPSRDYKLQYIEGNFYIYYPFNDNYYHSEMPIIKNRWNEVIFRQERIYLKLVKNISTINDSILVLNRIDSSFLLIAQNGAIRTSTFEEVKEAYMATGAEFTLGDSTYAPTGQTFKSSSLTSINQEERFYQTNDSMIAIYDTEYNLRDKVKGHIWGNSFYPREKPLLIYTTSVKELWPGNTIGQNYFVRFLGKNYEMVPKRDSIHHISTAAAVSDSCFVYKLGYFSKENKAISTKKCACLVKDTFQVQSYDKDFVYNDKHYLIKEERDTIGNIVRQELYEPCGKKLNEWPFDLSKRRPSSFNIDYKRPVDTDVNGECVFAYNLICYDHPIRESYSQYMYQSVQTKKDGLYIELDTTQVLDKLGLPRFGVSVINGTTDTLWFSTTDLKISLIVQAQDSMGLWHDIEYLNEMFYAGETHFFKCHIALPPANGWQFQVPVYQGASQVNMRLKLCSDRSHYTRRLPDRYRIHPEVYSEIFRGYINPAQMWRMPTKTIDFR